MFIKYIFDIYPYHFYCLCQQRSFKAVRHQLCVRWWRKLHFFKHQRFHDRSGKRNKNENKFYAGTRHASTSLGMNHLNRYHRYTQVAYRNRAYSPHLLGLEMSDIKVLEQQLRKTSLLFTPTSILSYKIKIYTDI